MVQDRASAWIMYARAIGNGTGGGEGGRGETGGGEISPSSYSDFNGGVK